MSADDGFLAWFEGEWLAGERALHDGDAAARERTWTRRSPVTLFGAWYDAVGPDEVYAAFSRLGLVFADEVDERIELIGHEQSGGLAYTVHREHTTTTIEGVPREYTLRVTQVYRREDDGWKVIHRHGDRGPTV
jgi:ketosteroid isomerase-like protein